MFWTISIVKYFLISVEADQQGTPLAHSIISILSFVLCVEAGARARGTAAAPW